MKIRNRFFMLIAVAILSMMLIVCFALGLLLSKNNLIDNAHNYRLQRVSESLLIRGHVADLVKYCDDVHNKSLNSHDFRNERFEFLQERFRFLYETVLIHIKAYETLNAFGEEQEEWKSFLQVWNEWHSYVQNIPPRLEHERADPSQGVIGAFQHQIDLEDNKRLELTARLNKSVDKLVEAGVQLVDKGTLAAKDEIAITVFVIVLSLLTLGVLVLSIRIVPIKPAESMVDALHESFQSLQNRMREVNYGVEMLAKGVQQVAADLSNLFALNAAIESARPKEDGFAVVSGEICALAECTSGLGGDIRDMADQVQLAIKDAMFELEQVAKQIGASGAGAKLGVNPHIDADRERSGKVAQAVSKISSALETNPVQLVSERESSRDLDTSKNPSGKS